MALVLIPGEGNQKYITFLYVPFCVLEEGLLFAFFSKVENSWIMGEAGRQGVVWGGWIVLVR